MTPAASTPTESQIDEQVVTAVRAGLLSRRKCLPPWLFYDEAGSRLFDEITELPEYYLTRTERTILARHADEMMARAASVEAGGHARLRIAELGAGSAEKTRILLRAAVAQQGEVLYEPVDVSATALLVAQARIEREIPAVHVLPLAMDYTNGFAFEPTGRDERRLVLYIGSSIGNFEPEQAAHLLAKVRAQLHPGDGMLLGVDLVKDEQTLLAAYDDAAGTTAAFNKNMLKRLNRELCANFDPEAFAHRAVWNRAHSRIEMHLESRIAQRVHFAALDFEADFAAGETIHTENSYKYQPGEPEDLLVQAGFAPASTWTDDQGWFTVCLGQVE
jgi:L-histidine N-alpha-methyltransferase